MNGIFFKRDVKTINYMFEVHKETPIYREMQFNDDFYIKSLKRTTYDPKYELWNGESLLQCVKLILFHKNKEIRNLAKINLNNYSKWINEIDNKDEPMKKLMDIIDKNMIESYKEVDYNDDSYLEQFKNILKNTKFEKWNEDFLMQIGMFIFHENKEIGELAKNNLNNYSKWINGIDNPNESMKELINTINQSMTKSNNCTE